MECRPLRVLEPDIALPGDDGPCPADALPSPMAGRSHGAPCLRGFSKPPSEMSRLELGRAGERAAERFLSGIGIEIVGRNWRCCLGEVDLVGEDDGCAVLVEVKTRRAPLGTVVPEEAVDAAKLSKYRELALMYLATNYEVTSVRFDIVGISVVSDSVAHVHYARGAYEWDD